MEENSFRKRKISFCAGGIAEVEMNNWRSKSWEKA